MTTILVADLAAHPTALVAEASTMPVLAAAVATPDLARVGSVVATALVEITPVEVDSVRADLATEAVSVAIAAAVVLEVEVSQSF